MAPLEGVRGLRDEGGGTEEEMSEVGLTVWNDRALRPWEVSTHGNFDTKVLVVRRLDYRCVS